MVLYCKAVAKAADTNASSMTGGDRYGFEMSAVTAEGPRPVRLAFSAPVRTPEVARAALVAMLNDAPGPSSGRTDAEPVLRPRPPWGRLLSGPVS